MVFLVHPPMASVLLSALVERCFVSRMRDFFLNPKNPYTSQLYEPHNWIVIGGWATSKGPWWNLNYQDKLFIYKNFSAIFLARLRGWQLLASFLARLRGWLFLLYDYRMRKVAHGLFVVSQSGAKVQHLTKLWPGPWNFETFVHHLLCLRCLVSFKKYILKNKTKKVVELVGRMSSVSCRLYTLRRIFWKNIKLFMNDNYN